MDNLQRVVIVGGSCVGKSTLAKRLAETLHVSHIDLDSLYWGPNWKENPPEQFRESLKTAIGEPSWICDGNYTFVRDIIWPRASTLLWLNYSFPVVFSRALRRTLSRSFHHTELYSGNRETFARSFFSRESILLWVLRSHHQRQKEIAQLLEQKEYSRLDVIEFRKPSETEQFASQVCP